jgi:transcriptional regulator with XRE-family HTH domain
MYACILATNILRLLAEQKMKRRELAKRSGVSQSFLSDVLSGEGNPSLKIMKAIANALQVSLPYLLEHTDLDERSLAELLGAPAGRLPPGYKRVSVVLPCHKAFTVERWGHETLQRLQDSSAS